ncbi:MAG: hypothetical protein FJ272_04165, partial [Planctomycetes bacterium]|nr:hypothetical protein [Planctomycetota bacterium]
MAHPNAPKIIVIMAVTLAALPTLAQEDIPTGQVKVKQAHRITHPTYFASNQFLTRMSPWNRDFTRVVLMESSAHTHPETKKRGRGFCSGFLSKLTQWKTLEEYEKAAKPVPGTWANFSLYWSPFPGEENIMYGVWRTPRGTIARVNVDTDETTTVLSYDPQDGTDISKAQGWGLTGRNALIVSLGESYSTSDVVEIDLKKKAVLRRFRPVPSERKWDSDENLANYNIFPRGGNHGDTSGSGKWYYHYRRQLESGDYGRGGAWSLTQRGLFIEDLWREGGIVTLSWTHALDSWFIGVNLGVPYKPDKPTISTYSFYQVLFDPNNRPHFKYHLLLEHLSATMWLDGKKITADTGDGTWVYNYHSLCKLQMRRDGRQFMFCGTDGTYTDEDFQRKGVTPWGYNRMFLVDLEPDTDAPPARRP